MNNYSIIAFLALNNGNNEIAFRSPLHLLPPKFVLHYGRRVMTHLPASTIFRIVFWRYPNWREKSRTCWTATPKPWIMKTRFQTIGGKAWWFLCQRRAIQLLSRISEESQKHAQAQNCSTKSSLAVWSQLLIRSSVNFKVVFVLAGQPLNSWWYWDALSIPAE